MDPTRGLAEKFRDIVLNQIWEQLLYLVCFGQNIEQLNERLVELTLEKDSIKHRIDEATNIADQEIDEKVVHWMGKVDEISEQVQKLHQESQGKRECSITSCPNPWLRYKLSKRAKAMARQVADIIGEGNFDRVSYRVPPQSMPELTDGESNEGIDSRVPIMNQIMEALQDPSVNMIGLCGLGGVGKTTIAKEVAIANHQNRFEKVIMVTVSQELKIEMIQRQIAEKLGIQINETTEDVVAYRLRERLKQKNVLLILDDLWEKLYLGKVGIPLIEGCKILLTSRDETLLSNQMNCQKIIKVGVLSEDEALELFKKIAELPIDSSSSDLMSIAIEIVRKCKGLPLAIATAAKALRGKDLNDWKDYRRRLDNPLRRNVTGIKEVDSILKVSVDLLSPENKDIFLLTGMLSHDPLLEELLVYAVGLDILKGIVSMKEAQEGIFAIVNKLKSLNLFLDSFSSHRVTIHDVVRDVAVSIASNELPAIICRRLKEWPDENMLKDRKVICSQESQIGVDLPEELFGPHLQFFLLDSTEPDLTIPSMFFKSSKELKVLQLTNVQFPSLRSLSLLQKLKALCLHSCLLEDITEVGSLKKLKVLSLAYSEIQQLPFELAKLKSLQMLNLSHCSKLRVIPPKILCSLKKLEVLRMINSFSQWKNEGSNEANENASLDELKGLPIYSLDIHIPNVSMLPDDLLLDMNLERYNILIGEHWEWWQLNDKTSKTLKLEIESSIHLKRGVQKLLEGVEALSLCGSNASNEVFKSLFKSKVLLPKVEVLELAGLSHSIPLIWDEQLSDNSFSNLKTLRVEWCGFVKLVPRHVLKSLNNLEKLEVKGCHKLETVFDFEDMNDYKGMESLSVVVPLKKLTLWALPKLKNVWSDDPQGKVSFPCLRSVTVINCDELEIFEKKISSSSEIQEEVSALNSKYPLLSYEVIPHNLEELILHGKQVEMIGSNQFLMYHFPKVKLLDLFVGEAITISYASLFRSFPNLERLVLKGDFEEIFSGEDVAALAPLLSTFTLWYISNMISLAPSLFSSPNLTHLQVISSYELTTLMTSSAAQCLVHLTHLSILYCDQIEEIITKQEGEYDDDQEIIFSKLNSLKLVDLPRLKRFCGHNYTFKFPLLKSIIITNCPHLTMFCQGAIHAPLLQSIQMDIYDPSKIIWRTNLNDTIQHQFDFEEVISTTTVMTLNAENITVIKNGFPKVESLYVESFQDEGVTFPYSSLERFPKLKELYVEHCSFEAIFPSHDQIVDLGRKVPPFERLEIAHLNQLKCIWNDDSQLPPIHQIIELIVISCCNLVKLAPSSASFQNLRELEVSGCDQLIHLVTISTAKSLVILRWLVIKDCKKMEEIVMNETNEDVQGAITFNQLQWIQLTDMPSLKMFSSQSQNFEFPKLEEIQITRCPEMKMFCQGVLKTPKLSELKIDDHDMKWKDEGDLNKTIETLSSAKDRY